MSQFRECEILHQILSVWREGSNIACEFGALDGTRSNTDFLKGWDVTLIEADRKLEPPLRANRPDAKVIMATVTPDNVNDLLPADLDYLSIDIDGNDYHVWEAIEQKPRIVIIEANPQRENWVMPRDDEFHMAMKHDAYGASADKLIELGQSKGYRLAATTGVNLVFVREDCPPLNIRSDWTVPKYLHVNERPPSGARLLKMDAKCVIQETQMQEQVKHALSLGLREFEPTPAHDREIAIVGSGPSLRGQIEALKGIRGHVMATHSAHDFLIYAGVVPDSCVSVDPLPKVKESFKERHRKIIYYLASQTHAEVFEHLKKYHVTLFHLLTGERPACLTGKLLVNGGTTTGMRAMFLAWLMGYRKFHLFGFDSCLSGDVLKVSGEKATKTIPVWAGGKEFICNPAMARQAYEFEFTVGQLPDIQIKAYGEGLIQHIVEYNSRIDSRFLSCAA